MPHVSYFCFRHVVAQQMRLREVCCTHHKNVRAMRSMLPMRVSRVRCAARTWLLAITSSLASCISLASTRRMDTLVRAIMSDWYTMLVT
jgi:hypothetical protein